MDSTFRDRWLRLAKAPTLYTQAMASHGQPWNRNYTLVVTPHARHLRDAARYCVDNALYILYNSTHSFATNLIEIQHLYLQLDGFLIRTQDSAAPRSNLFVLYILMDYTSVPYFLISFFLL